MENFRAWSQIRGCRGLGSGSPKLPSGEKYPRQVRQDREDRLGRLDREDRGDTEDTGTQRTKRTEDRQENNIFGLGGVRVPILFGNYLPTNDLPYSKGFMRFGCRKNV